MTISSFGNCYILEGSDPSTLPLCWSRAGAMIGAWASITKDATGPGRLGDQPIVTQQPRFRIRDRGEVFDISAGRRSLYLVSCQRRGNDDRQPSGVVSTVGEKRLELDDGVLRLDFHLTDIDKREMLIVGASKLGMGSVTGAGEVLYVSRREEPGHRHPDEVEGFTDIESIPGGHDTWLPAGSYHLVADPTLMTGSGM